MDYKNPKFIAIVVIAVILVWGVIGGVFANQLTNDCDIGFWELCWTWHKNLAGVFVEVLGG